MGGGTFTCRRDDCGSWSSHRLFLACRFHTPLILRKDLQPKRKLNVNWTWVNSIFLANQNAMTLGQCEIRVEDISFLRGRLSVQSNDPSPPQSCSGLETALWSYLRLRASESWVLNFGSLRKILAWRGQEIGAEGQESWLNSVRI
jgi:hypothetical protein